MELYLTQKLHQMKATPSVMALNLCNLDGIIRLATYIATTVTLVVAGKRRLLMLAPLSAYESFMETYDEEVR
jgi:hypothetical protein